MSGTLFVVATPIGNLEDLTFRALRTLREVDLIAAEDTRRTSKLLAHYEIRKPLVSLHEHNEHQEAPRLVARLQRGESVALVTDAGTPGVADPGSTLVRAARDAALTVVPIPGPSAVATALSVSGFSADEFSFMGFPPRSGTARENWFARLTESEGIVVFFEAPHRIRRTMTEARVVLAERPILLCRELTKINESLGMFPIYGEIESLRDIGEYVVVVGPSRVGAVEPADDSHVSDVFDRLTNVGQFSESQALSMTAACLSMKESDVRKALKRDRIRVNRLRDALS